MIFKTGCPLQKTFYCPEGGKHEQPKYDPRRRDDSFEKIFDIFTLSALRFQNGFHVENTWSIILSSNRLKTGIFLPKMGGLEVRSHKELKGAGIKNHFLVAGFNPSEKYMRIKLALIPSKIFGVKIRNILNHYPNLKLTIISSPLHENSYIPL